MINSLFFVWLTPKHAPRDLFKVSSPEWIEALKINLNHTVTVLDGWSITLLTNDKTLIPYTVQALNESGIPVQDFSEIFSERQITAEQYPRLFNALSCMSTPKTTECLAGIFTNGWINSSMIFAMLTVNRVKEDTALVFDAMCGDINLVFCKKPTEVQMNEKHYFPPYLYNGNGSLNGSDLNLFPFSPTAYLKDLMNPADFCEAAPNTVIADGTQGSWNQLVAGEN